MRLPTNDEAQRAKEHQEDALKHLLEAGESGSLATVESLAGAMGWTRGDAARVLGELRALNLAIAQADGHRLSDAGRPHALEVVRSHRLYETWLAQKTGIPPADWHRQAHKAEHSLRGEALDTMADQLGNPRFDPHGDPIPTREGRLPPQERISLASWPDAQDAEITHLEDEPATLYQQIRSLGLAPTTRIGSPRRLDNGSLLAHVDGRDLTIPAALAPLIHVIAATEILPSSVGLRRLCDLPIGEQAMVHGLTPGCTGTERSRLLDLGVVPGTPIRCEFASPFGNPRSYSVRGAMIALRNQQAERVMIV